MVVAAALCLGACTGSLGNAGSSAGGPTAEALSIQEYATRVPSAVGPLQTALKNLDKAKGYKGLAGRVTAVQQATNQAMTALRGLTPPTTIMQEHTSLLIALRQVYSELNATGDQVGRRRLCTGLAVRAKVGDDGGTKALRTVLASIKAKVPGTTLALSLPPAGQKVGARPANGAFIGSGSRGGRGTLTIENGGSGDAMVALAGTKGGKPAFSVYVRKGKKYTVKGIRDGDYRAYFTGGTGWDPKARAFAHDCQFERFEDPMDYKTTTTATRIQWSTWTIDLEKTPLGTAKTSEVDPNGFPEA